MKLAFEKLAAQQKDAGSVLESEQEGVLESEGLWVCVKRLNQV